MSGITNWDEIIKKEARGLDDYDLGEVQELNEEFVVTKRIRSSAIFFMIIIFFQIFLMKQ